MDFKKWIYSGNSLVWKTKVNKNKCYFLAVETSSRTGSAALGCDGKLLAAVEFAAGVRHGAELSPAVDRIMRQAGLQPGQMDVICVSSGPGSFTGLRVGFTFARCLAQLTGAKLIAVSSTRVIVENLMPMLAEKSETIYLAPILDAKRKQVYTAGYLWQDGKIHPILEECVLTPAQLMEKLGRPLWLTGEGLDYHRQSFTDENGLTFIDRPYWFGQAQNVLKLGFELAREGRFVPYNNFVPTYVRLPEAEERWQQQHPADH